MKLCKKCNSTLPHENFYKNKASIDGLTQHCKTCTYTRKTILHSAGTVMCASCKHAPRSTKYRVCVPCYNAKRQEKYVSVRRVPTLEQLEASADQQRAKNRDTYRRRRAKDPDAYRAKERKRQARRRRADPLYRLRSNIGRMKNHGYKKSSTTSEILQCSYQHFKEYIEAQFTPDMNWGNKNLWHLDHRVPCAVATNEQELLRLNRWDNFQPLWAFDNQEKFTKFNTNDPVYIEILKMRNKTLT